MEISSDKIPGGSRKIGEKKVEIISVDKSCKKSCCKEEQRDGW